MLPPFSGSKNKPRNRHEAVANSALMGMEVRSSSETLVDFKHATRHYVSEDRTLLTAKLIQSLYLK
jgi:hypothetical protein